MDRKKLINILKYVLGFGLGIGLLVMAMLNVDFEKVSGYFAKANYLWVGLALMVAMLSHWFRALRWKMLLDAAGYPSKTSNLFASIMVGYMVNQALPRAGEISRATLASRTEKVPFSTSMGTIVTDRIFDLIILGSLVATIFALEFDHIVNIMETAFQASDEGGGKEEGGGSWIKWVIIAIPVLMVLAYFVFRKKIRASGLEAKIKNFRWICGARSSVFAK